MANADSSTNPSICTIEGCKNPQTNKSQSRRCDYHLTHCSIAGCENSCREGRYCYRHNHIKKKYGIDVLLQGFTVCSAEGCNDKADFPITSNKPCCAKHLTICHEPNCTSFRAGNESLCSKHKTIKRRARTASRGNCTAKGCSLPMDSIKHKLCQKHLGRFYTHGDADHCQGTQRGEPLEYLKLLTQNMPLPNSCILWPYRMDVNGYGTVNNGEGNYDSKAHRISLALYTGIPLDDLPPIKIFARHLCPNGHNRACVNPLHLEWGTHQQNMDDKVLNGTSRKGSKSPASVLDEIQVAMILVDKRSSSKIANDYPVSRSQIQKIKRRDSWQHVNPADYI